MINAGTYKARAIPGSVKFGRASTGTEQIAVAFRLTDERADGTTLTWIGSFAGEQSINITIKGLRAAGWATDNLTDLSGLGDVECELVVEHEQDQSGTMRVKVKWVNEIGGGFSFKNEMGRGEVQSLADRIRGAAIASRQELGTKSAAPAARKPPAKPAAAWDGQGAAPPDDIPF